jgi:hypothetical protein
MNELPNKEEIKELYLRTIINDINKQISEFNKSITIPSFVYNIFKVKFEEKGYFVNSVIEDGNVIINIPLDDDNKITEIKESPYAHHIINIPLDDDNKIIDNKLIEIKKKLLHNTCPFPFPPSCKLFFFSEKILDDIIANKLDFNVELYKYKFYDIFADYMTKIYMNTDDNKLIKYIIDNSLYRIGSLRNTLLTAKQSRILRYFNFDIIIYLINKGVILTDTYLLNYVKEDIISKILSYAMVYKPFKIRINIFDPTYIKCWKIFNYKLLELYIEKSDLKNYVKELNYSKNIMKNLLIDNNNMDFNNKLEITKLLIKKLEIFNNLHFIF